MANGIIQAAGIDEELHKTSVVTVEGESILEAIDEFEENIGSIKSHFNLFYKEFLMGVVPVWVASRCSEGVS